MNLLNSTGAKRWLGVTVAGLAMFITASFSVASSGGRFSPHLDWKTALFFTGVGLLFSGVFALQHHYEKDAISYLISRYRSYM